MSCLEARNEAEMGEATVRHAMRQPCECPCGCVKGCEELLRGTRGSGARELAMCLTLSGQMKPNFIT